MKDPFTYIKTHGPRKIFEVIYQRKIQVILNRIMCFFLKKIPLKDIIVIESHNDFDTNGGAFYNYLLKNNFNQKYKIVWLLQNNIPKNLPNNVIGLSKVRPSIRVAYYRGIAKYLTSDHMILKRMRKGQLACYLTHGSISLKRTHGHFHMPNEIDCILTPSEFLAPIIADNFDISYPDVRQKILGYPIHDIFYSCEEGDLKKITTTIYRKVILWMPTFRKSIDSSRNDSNGELPLGIPILKNLESYKKLNTFLSQKNTLLIVKIHPLQDLKSIKVQELSNIIVLDRNSMKTLNVDNYRLMKDVDALISDYSSASYDFLHANKPIGYTVDDIKDFNLEMNFKDPEKYMPGHIIYTQEDFIQFIDDVISGKDFYAEKRKKVFDLFFKFHDGNSCQRLADYMGLRR